MKQPLKKKEVGTRKTLNDLKSKLGIGNSEDLNESNADKPIDWLVMPKAYQNALKLPGIPLSYVTAIVGHSNTGKSTLVNHAIIAAQKKGIIPVIYDTENNFDFTYAKDMGMEAEPIYGDVDVETVNPDTGEVTVTTENRIVRYEGNFIYFNSALLAERYGSKNYSTGKDEKAVRKTAVIEDVAASINELINAQDEGDINAGFLFIWDSVGSIGSYKSFKSAVGNNMFDAGAISVAFNGIINDKIPHSRKISATYSNTLIFVNKVWVDNVSSPMAPPTLSLKGGNSIYYGARLIILLGGQIKGGARKLVAQSNKLNYNYGIESKIKVLKNQLPNPWTITYEGTVYCTMHGMIATDEIDEYRKNRIGDILKQLSALNANNGNTDVIKESDVHFVTENNDEIE